MGDPFRLLAEDHGRSRRSPARDPPL